MLSYMAVLRNIALLWIGFFCSSLIAKDLNIFVRPPPPPPPVCPVCDTDAMAIVAYIVRLSPGSRPPIVGDNQYIRVKYSPTTFFWSDYQMRTGKCTLVPLEDASLQISTHYRYLDRAEQPVAIYGNGIITNSLSKPTLEGEARKAGREYKDIRMIKIIQEFATQQRFRKSKLVLYYKGDYPSYESDVCNSFDIALKR